MEEPEWCSSQLIKMEGVARLQQQATDVITGHGSHATMSICICICNQCNVHHFVNKYQVDRDSRIMPLRLVLAHLHTTFPLSGWS
ncbi:hypothetical protein TB2_020932 [Malus domestica]